MDTLSRDGIEALLVFGEISENTECLETCNFHDTLRKRAGITGDRIDKVVTELKLAKYIERCHTNGHHYIRLTDKGKEEYVKKAHDSLKAPEEFSFKKEVIAALKEYFMIDVFRKYFPKKP